MLLAVWLAGAIMLVLSLMLWRAQIGRLGFRTIARYPSFIFLAWNQVLLLLFVALGIIGWFGYDRASSLAALCLANVVLSIGLVCVLAFVLPDAVSERMTQHGPVRAVGLIVLLAAAIALAGIACKRDRKEINLDKSYQAMWDKGLPLPTRQHVMAFEIPAFFSIPKEYRVYDVRPSNLVDVLGWMGASLTVLALWGGLVRDRKV